MMYKMLIEEDEGKNFTLLVKRFKEIYPVDYWKECCFFVDKDIEQINEHWLKFNPPEKGHFIFLSIMYTILLVIGFTGNLTVIILYYRQRALRTPANTLIVNLAFSDLIMMCMIPIFLYNCYHFGPALGSIGCKFYGFLGGISGTVSICLLSAISFDRFHVIKYPLTRQPSFKRTKYFVLICWIYGATFSFIPVLDIGFGTYVPEAYLISCSYEYLTEDPKVRNFIFCFFVAAWVIPFCIIVYCYFNILHVVFSVKQIRTNYFKDSYRHIKKKQEIKVAIIVLIVICIWFIAWTPYSVVSLLGIFGREDLITPFGSMLPALFCKSASCLDPYIFALIHPKFKMELRGLLKMSGGNRRIESKPYCITQSRSSKDDDGVIEERVMVDLSKYYLHYPFYRINDPEAKAQATFSQPSWWARPSFNDKCGLAKARKLVRSMSTRDNDTAEK